MMCRQEQHIPSGVIDRGARGHEPPRDAFSRARARVDELVSRYEAPSLSDEVLREFDAILVREAERMGVMSPQPIA